MCMTLLRWGLLLVLAGMAFPSVAQSYTWDDFVQEYTEGLLAEGGEGEAAGEAVADNILQQWDAQLQELRLLHDQPVNINTATREELLHLPFLDEEQVEEIHAYVYLHGALQTPSELRLVPLLDSRTRRFLSLFVTFGNAPSASLRKHRPFAPVRQTLMTRLDVPLYYRRGYMVSDGYAGDPLYHRTTYRLQAGRHLRVGGRVEKDAGERWVDSWGAYAELKDLGMLRKAVVGDFRMGFGEGLVVGGSSWYARSTPVSRGQSGIRASTGTDEIRFLRGAAATLSLGKEVNVTLFASARQLDATLQSDGSVRTLLTTGLHRTSSERARKNNVNSSLFGGNLTWTHRGWHLGTTGYCQYFNRLLRPGDQSYRRYYPRGRRFGSVGVHYGWSAYRIVLAGETAYSSEQGIPASRTADGPEGGSGGWATLHRLTWRPTSRYTLSAVQRYYASSYHSFQAAALARGSRVQNENGMLLHLRAEPWDTWQLLTYVDFFHHPWPPYGCRVSRTGQEFQFQMLHPMGECHILSARYVVRHTVDDVHSTRHRIRLQWTCQPSSCWRLQSTATVLRTLNGTGGSFLQAVRYAPSASWVLSAVVGYSHPGQSGSGISEYLPTLAGGMGHVFFYGQTFHGTFLGRWQSRDGHWRLEARYGMRRVLGSSIQGTGLQTIYSPWRNDLAFQLTVKL